MKDESVPIIVPKSVTEILKSCPVSSVPSVDEC